MNEKIKQFEDRINLENKNQELNLKTFVNQLEDQTDAVEKLKRDILKKLDRTKENDLKYDSMKQEILNGIVS